MLQITQGMKLNGFISSARRGGTVLGLAAAAWVLASGSAVRADDFRHFEEPVPELPPENPGWVCSVTDLREDRPTPRKLVVSSSAGRGEVSEVLRDGRLQVRFQLGRPAAGAEPGTASAHFLSYQVSSSSAGTAPFVSAGQLSADDMSACTGHAGRIAPLRASHGLDVNCVPDTGFSNYFGVTSPDCENLNAGTAIVGRHGVADQALSWIAASAGGVGATLGARPAEHVHAYARDEHAVSAAAEEAEQSARRRPPADVSAIRSR
ncbi:MAG: hypothetical protein IT285_10465 [Bdellovibrionales bacterium]|nr:hypothetical protein [Bdellovibrionales bacterium]